jgi:hypothetical protein
MFEFCSKNQQPERAKERNMSELREAEVRIMEMDAFYRFAVAHPELNCSANKAILKEAHGRQHMSLESLERCLLIPAIKSRLAVLPDARVLAEQQTRREAEERKNAEVAQLQQIALENELHSLLHFVAAERFTDKAQQELEIKNRLQYWSLQQLRDEKQRIELRRQLKSASATEVKDILKASRPVPVTGGFQPLPAKWTRTAIRTADVKTLRHLLQRFGKAQLDARLAIVEEN